MVASEEPLFVLLVSLVMLVMFTCEPLWVPLLVPLPPVVPLVVPLLYPVPLLAARTIETNRAAKTKKRKNFILTSREIENVRGCEMPNTRIYTKKELGSAPKF